jgi:colanic acid/amylovoran biosynthesis protein
VFTRDRSGVEYIQDLLGGNNINGKVRFIPDVAFVLDPREPENIDVGAIDQVRTEDSVVVGLNISALLFNGGYSRENMFGLKIDYRELIYSVVDSLMKHKNVLVLLVPHVFTPHRTVEDDPGACQEMYDELEQKYPGRMFLTRGRYEHNDIKHIIGLCDFFVGSRMHACIAALSQSIPTVGIAYSKKFYGVFESIGVESSVADACRCNKDELLSVVETAFKKREQTRVHLNKVIPETKARILNMLEVGNTL